MKSVRANRFDSLTEHDGDGEARKDERPVCGFVGLYNQSNTCYLNSLVQGERSTSWALWLRIEL